MNFDIFMEILGTYSKHSYAIFVIHLESEVSKTGQFLAKYFIISLAKKLERVRNFLCSIFFESFQSPRLMLLISARKSVDQCQFGVAHVFGLCVCLVVWTGKESDSTWKLKARQGAKSGREQRQNDRQTHALLRIHRVRQDGRGC